MTIYVLNSYNRMEDRYDEMYYTKKENAEKAMNDIIKGNQMPIYKYAHITKIKTED